MEYCHCATIKKNLKNQWKTYPSHSHNLVLKHHLSPSFNTPPPPPLPGNPPCIWTFKDGLIKIPTSMLGCTCKNLMADRLTWCINNVNVCIFPIDICCCRLKHNIHIYSCIFLKHIKNIISLCRQYWNTKISAVSKT